MEIVEYEPWLGLSEVQGACAGGWFVWWWMSAVVDGEKRGLQDMCTLAAAGRHPDFPRQLHDTHCMNLAMVRNETMQCYSYISGLWNSIKGG